MQRAIAIVALLAMAACVSIACQRIDLPAGAASAPRSHPPCHPAPASEPQDQGRSCVSSCAVTQAEGKSTLQAQWVAEAVLPPADSVLPAAFLPTAPEPSAPADRSVRLRVLRL